LVVDQSSLFAHYHHCVEWYVRRTSEATKRELKFQLKQVVWSFNEREDEHGSSPAQPFSALREPGSYIVPTLGNYRASSRLEQGGTDASPAMAPSRYGPDCAGMSWHLEVDTSNLRFVPNGTFEFSIIHDSSGSFFKQFSYFPATFEAHLRLPVGWAITKLVTSHFATPGTAVESHMRIIWRWLIKAATAKVSTWTVDLSMEWKIDAINVPSQKDVVYAATFSLSWEHSIMTIAHDQVNTRNDSRDADGEAATSLVRFPPLAPPDTDTNGVHPVPTGVNPGAPQAEQIYLHALEDLLRWEFV
jgi:hypothetical protein